MDIVVHGFVGVKKEVKIITELRSRYSLQNVIRLAANILDVLFRSMQKELTLVWVTNMLNLQVHHAN